jgi:hypothetical protein
VEHCKITNSKHQITNKFQIPIPNDRNRFGILNFGHCDLFGIWDLLFGICSHPSTPMLNRRRARALGPTFIRGMSHAKGDLLLDLAEYEVVSLAENLKNITSLEAKLL